MSTLPIWHVPINKLARVTSVVKGSLYHHVDVPNSYKHGRGGKEPVEIVS